MRGGLFAFSLRDERGHINVALNVLGVQLWVAGDDQEEGEPHACEQVAHLLIQGGGIKSGYQRLVEALVNGGDFLVVIVTCVVKGGGGEGDERGGITKRAPTARQPARWRRGRRINRGYRRHPGWR